MNNVLAIIGEYNPFHNGHLYHIKESKELTNSDYTILIMSGNFVQRGAPALIDKWKRSQMAIENGIDLVVELPVLYSISSAENFANGSIQILNSLKIVNTLSFGSECGNISLLNDFTQVLTSEPPEYKTLLEHELSKGLSFPKARENALMLYLGDIRKYSNILNSPNNTLGIEYLKALQLSKSKIKAFTLQRQSSAHNSLKVENGFSSGTAIRNMIFENDFDSLFSVMPKSSYEILIDALRSGEYIADLSSFEKEIIFKLRNMYIDEIAELPDVSEGLENLIKESVSNCNTLDELIEKIKSKRYTRTRIQRILLYALLGYTKSDYEILKKNPVPYIRVLGFNDKGKELLSSISKNNKKLNVITSVKQFMDKNKKSKSWISLLEKDILSTDIYTLGYSNNSKAGLDYTKKLITL